MLKCIFCHLGQVSDNHLHDSHVEQKFKAEFASFGVIVALNRNRSWSARTYRMALFILFNDNNINCALRQ